MDANCLYRKTIIPLMQPYVLNTERLLLRPLTIDDVDTLWPYVSNPEISKDMSWQAHQNISETKEFIQGVIQSMELGKSITWAIFMNDQFCGVFSLIAILRKHRSLVYDRAEIAYWAGLEFQKKG